MARRSGGFPTSRMIGPTRAMSLVVLVWTCCAQAGDTRQRWVPYEPAVVELRGTLKVCERYGPPGYGEDPERDQRMRVPVLILSNPINVRGDPAAEVNIESVRGVRELQLVFLRAMNYSSLVGSQVVVRGKLSHAVSGHHFTPVVMIVESLGEDAGHAEENDIGPG